VTRCSSGSQDEQIEATSFRLSRLMSPRLLFLLLATGSTMVGRLICCCWLLILELLAWILMNNTVILLGDVGVRYARCFALVVVGCRRDGLLIPPLLLRAGWRSAIIRPFFPVPTSSQATPLFPISSESETGTTKAQKERKPTRQARCMRA
jgi:hypothetical protein